MTKVTILGQEPKEEKKLKPIEFVSHINLRLNRRVDISLTQHPTNWDNIILLEKEHIDDLDLMYAWDDDKLHCALFLGHFNDGVVA